MKTIRRYIFWEILGPFLLGVLVFSFVLLMGIIGQPGSRNPLQLLAQKNVTLGETLLIFLYLVPRILTLSLPMAVLLAILIGFGRLSADSEITALRSSGIGTLNLFRPVFVFALGAWLIAMLNSLFWYPQSLQQMRRLANEIGIRSISTEVREGVFEENFSNLVLYVRKTSMNRSNWKNIFVADLSNKDQLKVTLANQGNLISDPIAKKIQLHLTDGAHHLVDNKNPDVYQVMPFDQIDVPVASMNLPTLDSQQQKLPVEEITTRQLISLKHLDGAKEKLTPKEKREREIELPVRLALPFSVIIFALVGLPLGVVSKRGEILWFCGESHNIHCLLSSFSPGKQFLQIRAISSRAGSLVGQRDFFSHWDLSSGCLRSCPPVVKASPEDF